MERVLGNKVIFSNLVIYSLSILTSCQFTNEPNREISRGVFQNRGVCREAFPLLPSSSPFHFFFAPALTTRLETLATQAQYICNTCAIILFYNKDQMLKYKRFRDGRSCRLCNLQYLQNTYIFRKKTFASAAFFGSAVPDDSLAMR